MATPDTTGVVDTRHLIEELFDCADLCPLHGIPEEPRDVQVAFALGQEMAVHTIVTAMAKKAEAFSIRLEPAGGWRRFNNIVERVARSYGGE